MNELKLLTGGKVQTKDNREFTQLLGGFGENKPSITDKQVAELLEYKHGARQVREQISKNKNSFTYGADIKDIKRDDDSDTLAKTLISLGYAKQSITQAENIYIFSEAGFLLFLKFAEGEKAIEIYKDFIEDYFKTKAENIVMENTLQEELKYLEEQRIITLGRMFVEQNDSKKMEYFNECEKANVRIHEIEITLSKEKLVEQLQPQLEIAKTFTHAKAYYDMGIFSKILKIQDLGRNNLFKWLRKEEILMHNNQPYQKYMNYFEILPLENKYTNRIDYKTMVRPNGVEYIVKRLIKDGKIVPKPIDEILSELEQFNEAI